MLENSVILIAPLNSDTGKAAYASQSAVGGLREGTRTNGVVVVVTATGARIFRPAAAKGASKTWNEYFCDSAALVRRDEATALVGLFGDGAVRTFTIPGLKEVSSLRVERSMDVRRFDKAIITPTADIFGFTGPSEILVVNPWGSGQDTYVIQPIYGVY